VRLGLDTIRELVAKEEPDVEITSLEEAPGSGRGDNYTSMLYRLSVKGHKSSGAADKVPWERSIIYKVLPESKEHREAFKSELLFRNEVVFYTRVWPALAALQAGGRAVFEGVAKVYVARAELIAMEDLRAKGFKMADRRKGLQVDKLKRVLKALAGFHALSLTLKDLRYARTHPQLGRARPLMATLIDASSSPAKHLDSVNVSGAVGKSRDSRLSWCFKSSPRILASNPRLESSPRILASNPCF
jgi:hypothetical protein